MAFLLKYKRYKIKRIAFLFFVIVQLSVIVYNNIILEEQTIRDFYFHQKDYSKAQALLEKWPLFYKAFDAYSKYTGTETGYGFYAPNVSSQTILLFTTRDKNGRIISMQTPRFTSVEAMQRCFTAFDIFLDKMDKPNKMHDQVLNCILKSMALWILETNRNCKTVEADLMVYALPTPAQVNNNNQLGTYKRYGHYVFSL